MVENCMPIRILLVDDHRIMRDGLKSMLQAQTDFAIVGEAQNGRQAVRLAADLSPDVVVMDVGMPDLNGVEATQQIRQQSPGVKILALSMQSDGPVVRRILQAGATGYILKDSAFDDLVKAIRVVASGKTYVDSDVAGLLVGQMNSPDGTSVGILTPKEREVLQLIAEGQTTKGIAAKLFVSPKTVDTHRQHIMDKLNIHSIAELTKFAIREGLTSLHG
jgi:DNA-binding NarL/FixJ family response regulator